MTTAIVKRLKNHNMMIFYSFPIIFAFGVFMTGENDYPGRKKLTVEGSGGGGNETEARRGKIASRQP